jgi:hypothetical protein
LGSFVIAGFLSFLENHVKPCQTAMKPSMPEWLACVKDLDTTRGKKSRNIRARGKRVDIKVMQITFKEGCTVPIMVWGASKARAITF